MSTWTIVRGATSWPTAGLRGGCRETDTRRPLHQGAGHEADMLVEVHAQLLGAAVDILSVDGAREALVLELLLDRARLEPRDGAPGTHQGAGGDEARELVAGVQPAVEKGDPRIARVVGVGTDRVDDVGRHASRQQYLGALYGMLRRDRVHLVVEVVEHAGRAPRLGVLAVACRIGPHGGLDGQRVLAEAVGLGELRQQDPGAVVVHQDRERVRHLSIDFLENPHCPSCPSAGMRRSAAIRLSVSASMERYVDASVTVIVSLGITSLTPP